MVPTLNQVPNGFQNVAYTGTAGTSTPVASYDASKKYVNLRLCSSSDCYYLVVAQNLPLGTVVVASAAVGSYLPAFTVEYIRVPERAVISVVQASAAGTLNITVMQDVTY